MHSVAFLLADPAPPGLMEKVVACIAIGLFGLIGFGLIRAAIGEFRRVARCRDRLVRLPGKIVNIFSERRYRAGTNTQSRHDTGYVMHFFPVISFTKPSGEKTSFRSEIGDSYPVRKGYDGSTVSLESRYKVGEEVEVFFDPEGEMKPCLASGWNLWFMGVGMLAAGLIFCGASLMILLIAREKVFV